ncbi:MAG: DUF3868 domain-containing protein [Paramuribaculum sp.]|nr:DUF3868 domain-containing protein [Paramuribaculum sp.]
MNKTLLNIISAAAILIAPAAIAAPVTIQQKGFTIEKTNTTLYVTSQIDLSQVRKGSNREAWITPVIRNGNDSVALPTIVVAGRNRYYQALRHDMPAKKGLELYRRSDKLTAVDYKADVPYEAWMNGSELVLHVDYKGCCNDELLPSDIFPITPLKFEPKKFQPVFNWIAPQAEAVKHRELKGQAYIDFPVNQTVIYPDYRRNTVELAKIQATIDSVHNDKDVTINTLSIKGFASPEGPWNNNVRLAKGRTAALKDYVENLYHFAPGFIKTSFEPEDWEGLKAYVQGSNITNREGILEIIDSSLQPDPKNTKLEKTYPEQYKFLLANVYPALRHSDYKIEYTIKSYNDVNEIIAVAKTRPQNLSLQEFFFAANSLEPGTDDYNTLFETAVRMYPESEVANLNAANAAMVRKDYVSAEKYLEKAGDTPEAIYAKGVVNALLGKYDAARTFFQQAARLKVADAPAALQQLDEIQN